MAAEGAGDGGGVDLHVVHRLQDMAHEADAGAAEVVEDAGHGAPLANLAIGAGVALKLPDDRVGHGAAVAFGDARELRHGAEVVVEKLAVDGGVFVVEALVGLQRHKDDRYARQLAHEWREGRGGGVGHHVDEEEVEVRRLHCGEERDGGLGVVGHAEAGDGRRAFQFRGKGVLLAPHVVKEAGALRPVGVETDAHHADVGGKGLAPFDGTDSHVAHSLTSAGFMKIVAEILASRQIPVNGDVESPFVAT